MRNHFICILLLVAMTMYSAMAKAIEQDSEGYYLIGSVEDWKAFAEIVKTNNAANARMTADIDLGDDQTHIGSLGQYEAPFYAGIFDGRGHTLTVAYVGTGNEIAAPFTNTRGATIKNLHVAGSIQSTFAFIAVVGFSTGPDHISNVWMSADIKTPDFSGWSQCAAIVGGVDNSSHITVTDCLFTGKLTVRNEYSGCFVGYVHVGSSADISNCLSLGTFNKGRIRGNHTNCYIKEYPTSIPTGMRCTDVEIADGTLATKLQAERAERVWVQDPESNQPRLVMGVQPVITSVIGAGGYSTFVTGSSSGTLNCDGGEIFTATVNNGKLILTKRNDNNLPAGANVIIKARPSQFFQFVIDPYVTPAAMASCDLKGGNSFVVDESQAIFALATIDGVTAFYRVNAGVNFPANRAYLDLTEAACARELTMVEMNEETTAMSVMPAVSRKKTTAYNLAGQPVDDNYKGIVIVNDKKVITK